MFESADLCSANIFFSRDVKAMEYEEIRKATSNFRPARFSGGPGYHHSFYKGWIDENYVAAVKPGSGIAVAVTVDEGRDAGIAYWFEKRINLSQYRHPNLVIPIGYYADTTDTHYTRIFVKEFMARGSLDRHLFIEQKPLPWATRMRVAVGAARGLAFLHNLEIPVMYGVLMSGDILLDADFNAKLSDFGTARDGGLPDIESPWYCTNLIYGYGLRAAPELLYAGRSRSTECDVYSFGVVLIELMSGLRGGGNYNEWGNLIMDLQDKRTLQKIMDVRLEGNYLRKEAYKVAHIALQCVNRYPGSRPTMAEVVAELEKIILQSAEETEESDNSSHG